MVATQIGVRDVKFFLKWIVGGGLVVAMVLQFTGPARSNPPVRPGHDLLSSNAPPAPIAALLKKACYDCHSYETRWPWYSYVAPLSWSLVGHVNDAREMLNFSDWPHDHPERARKKWRRAAEAIDSGEMPLRQYLWLHREARLDPSQRQQLARWAEEESKRLASSP
ncbi:MAG: heme-binding domain-containing protein [Limisphaerales bacterium]